MLHAVVIALALQALDQFFVAVGGFLFEPDLQGCPDFRIVATQFRQVLEKNMQIA